MSRCNYMDDKLLKIVEFVVIKAIAVRPDLLQLFEYKIGNGNSTGNLQLNVTNASDNDE